MVTAAQLAERLGAVVPGAVDGMVQAAPTVLDAMRLEASTRLTRRTGALVASFRIERDGAALRIVSAVPYAVIQDQGGTIIQGNRKIRLRARNYAQAAAESMAKDVAEGGAQGAAEAWSG